MKDKTEDNKMEVIIDTTTKELMDHARNLVNFNQEDFIRISIQEKAKAIIAKHEDIVFSEEDWRKFNDAIENPPDPNKRLKEAAKEYKESS